MQSDGTAPDNSGDHPIINRFLTRHSSTTPEQFIAALPDLYKEQFVITYASAAAAKDHVSSEHPRIISFGGDGGFTFAWNTNPDAPSQFRDSVEFRRQNEADWTAGVIDFSGDAPAIKTPASCQSCHGSLNKPLWGAFDNWRGSEYVRPEDPEVNDVVAWNEGVVKSTTARVKPLDISASHFLDGKFRVRLMQTPGQSPYVTAVEEAGSVWSWRHVEVLFERLKAREDYRSFAEETVCNSQPAVARLHALGPFSLSDHNPAVLSSTNQVIQGGSIGNAFVGPDYHYHPSGELGGALVFLMVVDLCEQESIVSKLYRDTSNADTIAPSRRGQSNVLLYYYSGSATAEDELIQKLRLHFGRGTRASLEARGRQNGRYSLGGNFSAAFFDGHLEVMAPRICGALTKSMPRNLDVELDTGNAILSWDGPADTSLTGLTGYRILRGVGGTTPAVHVSDTGSTDTTWTDEDPAPGEYVYAVKAIYDDYYLSRESDRARQTVTQSPQPTPAPTPQPTPAALTASFHDTPEDHNGTDAFTFQLRFSEQIESLSYKTLRDHAFTVTGGSVTGARRVEQESNVRWEITVEPDGNGDASIVLPPTQDCADQGAICTGDGGRLSNRNELTVPGPDPPSTDDSLSSLAVSGVTLAPAFASGTYAYTANVGNGVTETTVTPATNDDGASHVIKLGGVTDADGTVSLAVGDNVITVEVTAEDGSTTPDLHRDGHPGRTAFHRRQSE